MIYRGERLQKLGCNLVRERLPSTCEALSVTPEVGEGQDILSRRETERFPPEKCMWDLQYNNIHLRIKNDLGTQSKSCKFLV